MNTRPSSKDVIRTPCPASALSAKKHAVVDLYASDHFDGKKAEWFAPRIPLRHAESIIPGLTYCVGAS